MKVKMRLLLWSAAFVLVAVSLHAQSGCTDSPENPTSSTGVGGWGGCPVFGGSRTPEGSPRALVCRT